MITSITILNITCGSNFHLARLQCLGCGNNIISTSLYVPCHACVCIYMYVCVPVNYDMMSIY